MKQKTNGGKKRSAGLRGAFAATLALAMTLMLTLGMLPAAALKTQAEEISSITASVTNLVEPELGSLVVLPKFTWPDDAPFEVGEYGWTCDGTDRFEGEAFTPGTWRVYACATIDRGSSTDTFSSTPTLTVDGINWTLSETFSDEYFHYAIFYKEYPAITSPINVSGNPAIPETIGYTVIDELNLAGYVSGGITPYKYSKISGPEWLNIDPNTGVISGIAQDATAYNDDLNILITDANGQKGVAVVSVGPTKPDMRTAVYAISARGTSPGDFVKTGDTLKPITFTNLDPSYVSTNSSKDSWQKYNSETGTWESQEFGTTFTAGTYRYRAYMSADRTLYSFVHPDFYLEIEEGVWENPWTLDNYNSSDAWAYYCSDEYYATETIDTVSISGVPYPMDGSGASIGEIKVKEDGAFTSYEVWYNKTDNLEMSDGDPFEAGKDYRIKMTLYAEEGYTFADASDLKIKVNGLTPAVTWIDNGEVLVECDIPMAVASSNVYVVTAGALNIRDSASYNSDRIGGLKFGDLVQAQENANGFVKFDYEGQEAWVNASYLALTYSEDTAIYPEKYTVTATINVRESFSTSSTRIGGLTPGKQVLVTGIVTNVQGEEWLVIEYPTETGFVLGFIMEKYTESESAKKDEETPELKWTGGVPAHVSFATKSAVAYNDQVTVKDENYKDNEDGTYDVQIYPDDGMNFTTLTVDKIKLPTDYTLSILSMSKVSDGSIHLKMGPKPENPVTVTFELNGGLGTENAIIEKGTKVSKPENPSKEDYAFCNWYADPECTTLFDFNSPINEDTTIYAKWLPVVTAVNMHADGTEVVGGNYQLKADTLEVLFEKDTEAVGITLSPLYATSDEYGLSDPLTEAPLKETTYYFMIVLECAGDEPDGNPSVFYSDDAGNNSSLVAEDATVELVEYERSPGGRWASLICKYTESEISYIFSKGADGSWTKGSSGTFDLTINRNINDAKTFSLFESIEVDGAVVDAANYAASSGSLNASLKASYLDTLASGSHTLKVNFKDGSAETKLTINDAPANSSDDSNSADGSGDKSKTGDAAKTVDSNNIVLYLGLLFASLIIFIGVIGYKKRVQ